MTKKKGQITIEFLLLLGMALVLIMVLLASILAISEDNTKNKAFAEMDDLGKALQQEFLLASKMEDGYTRRINVPITENGVHYNITLGQTNPKNSYLLLTYGSVELFYLIPPSTGNITFGNNILTKNNNTLRIN